LSFSDNNFSEKIFKKNILEREGKTLMRKNLKASLKKKLKEKTFASKSKLKIFGKKVQYETFESKKKKQCCLGELAAAPPCYGWSFPSLRCRRPQQV